jgi:HPt (histidine-containing phosphotransfer) domain-containing protein
MNTTLENASPIEKLFDLELINKFCRGDINLTKKMIEVFIKDIPVSVEEIKQAYRENDFIKMKKTAHRIKPVLSMYSIVKVGKEIEVLEMMGQEDIKTAETELKINKLDSIINLVTQQMNTYIS